MSPLQSVLSRTFCKLAATVTYGIKRDDVIMSEMRNDGIITINKILSDRAK